MLTSKMLNRPTFRPAKWNTHVAELPRPTIIRPEPDPIPDFDVMQLLAAEPAKYIEWVNASAVPMRHRRMLLDLVGRSQEDIVNDFIANWYIMNLGSSPIEHDYRVIPDRFLPQVQTVEGFNQWLDDFRKLRAGLTPQKVIRTNCREHFTINDSAITEQSNVTVEIAPEIVEIENGKMSFFLKPDGYNNLIIRVRN